MAEASSATDESETRRPLATDSFTLSSFVDEVECRVENLRREANSLVGERASLLMIMDQLKSDCLNVGISPEDCQELLTNMDRLKARCEAVTITVHTVRDEGQQHSLGKVNMALEELQIRLDTGQSGPCSAILQARSYLNACLPEAMGPVDSRFQSLVLGCTVDDQKDVRRRLESLLRECSFEHNPGVSQSVPRRNSGFPSTDLSNNSKAEENSASLVEQPAGNPLPSDVVIDKKTGAEEVDNYLTAQWYTSPRHLSGDMNTQSGKMEEKGVKGSPPHSRKADTSACSRDHDSSVSHSGS